MKNLFFCLLLALLSSLAVAETEVVTLHHRSVDEVLPVIRPLLEPDGVASGMNNQLILRTSRRNLSEIKKVLESIDSAPRRLRITVLQNVDRATVSRLVEASGSVGVGGHARVTVPPAAEGGGFGVEAARGEDRLRVRAESTRALAAGHKGQQVQVLEGNRAFIHAGTSAPIPQRQIVQSPSGTQMIDTTSYRDVTSGFYVLPRVSGDRVMLEISTRNDSLPPVQRGHPTPDIQRTATTLSGRLGEWLVVGDIGQQQESAGATIASRGDSRTDEQRSVLLKVEEVE